jgi:hypothetical protein
MAGGELAEFLQTAAEMVFHVAHGSLHDGGDLRL